MPALRVVHVSAYFAPAYGFGGPPRSLLALCQAQQAAGLDVEMFTTTANPGGGLTPAPDGRLMDGVPTRYFPLSAPELLLGARSMAAPLALALRRADVAHLHGLFNRTIWTAGRLVARAAVPSVVSPRGMLEPAARAHHHRRKQVAWHLCDRRIVHQAARWHATSGAEADTLRSLPPHRTVVEVPNAVTPVRADLAQVVDARRRAGVPGTAPYLLFLGRLHPIKRLDLLAEAFAHIAGTQPDAHLVIAGPDAGGYRRQVEPLFAPVAARVHWCGEVDGGLKAGLLAGARALVACSDSESFGMSIAEALSAGTPIVATHTCPWPLIAAERLGHWVPQTADAVAEAMHAVLSRPDDARAQGERAIHVARERFSPDAVGRRWSDIYAELADARRGEPSA